VKRFVWGRQPVLETLRSQKPVHRVILRHGVRGEGILKIRLEATQREIPIEELPPKVFDKLMGKLPAQGVSLELDSEPGQTVALEDIIHRANSLNQPPFVLMVDGVKDPQNLGAILRSAEGAGVHGVVIRHRRSAPISGAVMKASAGAAAHLSIAQVPGLPAAVEQLKEKGIWVTAATQDGEEAIFNADLTGPIALVVGSEDKGVSSLVRKRCDRTIRIPMRGQIESLNVAATTAIVLFEILRQRSIQNSTEISPETNM
jgi:23S rRNA (guanosine2251-2'-O)-methyltransferase